MDKPLQGQRIGFIGLGVMGKPMAGHLHAAGAALTIHNRSQGVIQQQLGEWAGVASADSSAEVAEKLPGEVIVLMLTNTPAVEAVAESLTSTLKPGTLVIDMSTTSVSKTREWAEKVKALGGGWVDAPVSGGQFGAEGASLAIMAGGGEADFERAKPILEVMGAKITHLGPVGAGQITKLANQTIVGIGVAALAEALTLAKSAGVDPAKVRDAIRGGFAESRLLEEHGERMVNGDFEPGGRATYQLKDVREARQLMRDLDLDLPMLSRNVELWEEMVDERGMGEVDHSGIFKMYEEGRG
ncbi:MAG: 3-hydroxyisobutyrate dehydrogenase-like beta-hydroxyacid dehydrogenase [Verrucomicrobiales bacterium]|jgi:3-hydroxyisobutyrate dehydrogenase-like beta-hydroxyacid dehydrogenase